MRSEFDTNISRHPYWRGSSRLKWFTDWFYCQFVIFSPYSCRNLWDKIDADEVKVSLHSKICNRSDSLSSCLMQIDPMLCKVEAGCHSSCSIFSRVSFLFAWRSKPVRARKTRWTLVMIRTDEKSSCFGWCGAFCGAFVYFILHALWTATINCAISIIVS